MQRSLVRLAAFAVPVLLASLAGGEEPTELYPCAALLRLGTMDENGTVTRPTTPRQHASAMKRNCDNVVLGRFVSVTDSHYDELFGPAEQPVLSTFQVSEVLHGGAVATAAIRLERSMLVAPDEDMSRHLSSVVVTADEIYRYELAADTERELGSIRDSGLPLTHGQHERLVDAVKRLAEVPPRTRYELHGLADSWIATNSPLTFHMELGAIRPDEVYLLGLSDDNKEPPAGGHFHAIHTYLFWGREAQDIAAALREMQD